MQFESKPVKLPRHAQSEILGTSRGDADSPPAGRLQGLLLGGLRLSSSTYQTSPSSLSLTHCFPIVEFVLSDRGLREGFDRTK